MNQFMWQFSFLCSPVSSEVIDKPVEEFVPLIQWELTVFKICICFQGEPVMAIGAFSTSTRESK